MRPIERARPDAFRTNGPRHRECTVANYGQQRPPF